MKLQFKVNPYYLLIHSLGKAWGDKPFPLWAKLANMAKSNPSFIFKNSDEVFTRVNNDKQLRHVFQKTQNILSTLLKTHEFKRLLQETERYCIWTEKEWNKNKDQALRILEDITGIQFPDTTVTVIVTHPQFSNGSNIPREKVILWGHPEEWKNYTIVYLCHELLHLLVHKKYSNEEVMHSIIELATDNELRIRLNKKGIYFQEGKMEVGHLALRDFEKRLFRFWKQYLRGSFKAKNIFDFEKEVMRKLTLK